MMRWLSLLGLLMANGCALQLATGAGASFSEARSTHPKWSGTASAAYVGTTDVSFKGGLELDGRHEFNYGTTYHLGVMAGFVKNPGTGERIGGGLTLDVGTPLIAPTLFPDGDLYVGATGEMLVWLGGERGPTELNASPWLLVSQPEFVLRGRLRSHHHFDDDPLVGHEWTFDAEGGVGLRIRFISEYF